MEECYEQSDKLKSCVKAEDFTTVLVTRTSQDRYCAMYEVLHDVLCVVRSRNCVIPVVRVRTLGSVGSRTQLLLRCNFSDYVLRNNYMFRPMVA